MCNFQERQFGTTPLVKCGAKNFSKVKEFMMRFPTIPDVSNVLAYVIMPVISVNYRCQLKFNSSRKN